MPCYTPFLLYPLPGSSLRYLPPSVPECCDVWCVFCLLSYLSPIWFFQCCLYFGRKKTVPPNVDLAFLGPAPQSFPTQPITHLVRMSSVDVSNGPLPWGC